MPRDRIRIGGFLIKFAAKTAEFDFEAAFFCSPSRSSSSSGYFNLLYSGEGKCHDNNNHSKRVHFVIIKFNEG